MKLSQDIIIKPIITEASMMGIVSKKYTFKVATDANKVEIARAVEELFGVKFDDKTLVVGDSLSSDIQGGINAKIKTCFYNKEKKRGKQNEADECNNQL